MQYFEDENMFRLVGMGTETAWCFAVKVSTKQDNKYTIDIVEYTQSWERETDLNPGRIIISNSVSAEITSFNKKYCSASNG